MSKQRVLKITLCGESAVGKSSIGCRLANKEPDLDYTATVGVDYFARIVPSYDAKIGIWDLAGNSRFETVTLPYIKCTNTIVYVYDITRPSTVQEMQRLHKIHLRTLGKLGKIKILVVANKNDIENNHNTCLEAGKQFADSLGAPHVLVSAKMNKGIDDLLSILMIEMELDTDTKIKNKEDIRMCDNCILS